MKLFDKILKINEEQKKTNEKFKTDLINNRSVCNAGRGRLQSSIDKLNQELELVQRKHEVDQ